MVMRRLGMRSPGNGSNVYQERLRGENSLMHTRVTCGLIWVSSLVVLFAGRLQAQDASVSDEQIDQIRGMQNIGVGDQGRIGKWVEAQVTGLATADPADQAAFRGFLDKLDAQYTNRGNTGPFAAELAAQLTNVAKTWFAKMDVSATVAQALALILVRMDRVETVEGLLLGLESRVDATRALCARGLAKLRVSIAAGNSGLDRTIQALRAAGSKESDSVALGYMYSALAYPGHAASVFDVYMELFDKRLDARRASGAIVDRAEVEAFEYFRIPAVRNALSADQKAGLAQRLAVFLRLDAQRYHSDELEHGERDALERRLDGAEAILAALVPGAGGDLCGELRKGGHASREAVLQQAYRWVGHPETNDAGALNAAPWNVPVGAP